MGFISKKKGKGNNQYHRFEHAGLGIVEAECSLRLKTTEVGDHEAGPIPPFRRCKTCFPPPPTTPKGTDNYVWRWRRKNWPADATITTTITARNMLDAQRVFDDLTGDLTNLRVVERP